MTTGYRTGDLIARDAPSLTHAFYTRIRARTEPLRVCVLHVFVQTCVTHGAAVRVERTVCALLRTRLPLTRHIFILTGAD